MNRTRSLSTAAIVAAFSLFLILGCGGEGRKLELPPASPEGARILLKSASDKAQSLEADFSFGFQAMLFKGTLFGQCWLELPDRFAADLKAPLGIRAGEVVMSDGLYEIKMGNGQAMSGDVDSLDFMDLTGIALPTDDLLVLFDPVARPPAIDSKTIEFEVAGNDSLWLWRLDEKGMVHEIELSPKKGQLFQESWRTAEGKLVLKKEYKQFEEMEGVQVAKQLRISAQGKLPVIVEITFNRVDLNPRWKETPFQFKWTELP